MAHFQGDLGEFGERRFSVTEAAREVGGQGEGGEGAKEGGEGGRWVEERDFGGGGENGKCFGRRTPTEEVGGERQGAKQE
ncbi:inositol monophosphatase, putative [Babesia ovata]|uniref:Inositol monophosphatase, putative n=1 Tax=Babesia ovata TaxID=189622 RepID=A0A2H6KJN8_9APIC|nr:inositol monophosphatase, putative [Babesia ovata]GBE63206.1 inositol monophosphatase, putative [Babesia ovata]